jgi:hypothetical protein
MMHSSSSHCFLTDMGLGLYWEEVLARPSLLQRLTPMARSWEEPGLVVLGMLELIVERAIRRL